MDFLRLLDASLERTLLLPERLDLALPGEDARVARVRSVEAQGVPAELVAVAIHQNCARGEAVSRARRGHVLDCETVAQPVLDERADRLVDEVDEGRERPERQFHAACSCGRSRPEDTHFRGRWIVQKLGDRLQVAEL